MGLLAKLFGALVPREDESTSDQPTGPVVPHVPDWAHEDWRNWPPPRNLVRGESYYQAHLRRLCGRPRQAGWLVPVDVELVAEPRNRHDRNAVRADVAGLTVGYLDAFVAAQLSRPLQRVGGRISVPGVIRGGWTNAHHLGVHVWLDRGEHEITIDPSLGGEVGNWPPRRGEGVDVADEIARIPVNRKLAGTSVCFVGRSPRTFFGAPLSRKLQAQLAEAAGLVVYERFRTTQPPHMLVTCGDGGAATATRARALGVEVMDEAAFWARVGVDLDPPQP